MQSDNSEHDKLIGTIAADRYEIIARLGQGAMGTVYKAKHTSIGRFFALKTLNAHIAADERSLKRFEAEARAMSVLTHPNLIQISDYGKTADGIPFFVMEYLDGISLTERIAKTGRLPLEQALPIFAQIADALEHAHSKGLIHRDLKPSNIMLIGENLDFPKVVDLGIAKLLTDGLGTDSQQLQLTMTGEIFGSPLYMSPEQCQGDQLDGRSDIYSFGCVMYEALAGRPPFKGKNVPQTIYLHMHETAARITYLSEDISDLVAHCLAKEPESRPPTMAAVRDRLRAISAKASSASPSSAKSTVRTPQAPPQPLDATMVQSTDGRPARPEAGPRGGDAGAGPDAATRSDTAPPVPPPQPDSRSKIIIIVGIAAALVSLFVLVGGAVVIGVVAGSASRNAPQMPLGMPPTAMPPPTNPQQTDEYIKAIMDRESPLFENENAVAPQELDVVGVYTAQPPSKMIAKHKTGSTDFEPGNLEVVVKPKDKPITLVLVSYFPVNWTVKPMPGANVQKVIASGFFEQKVSGVNCKVDTHYVTDGKKMTHDEKAVHTGNIFVTYQPDEHREEVLENMNKIVKELIGPDTEMRRFKGRYYGNRFDI